MNEIFIGRYDIVKQTCMYIRMYGRSRLRREFAFALHQIFHALSTAFLHGGARNDVVACARARARVRRVFALDTDFQAALLYNTFSRRRVTMPVVSIISGRARANRLRLSPPRKIIEIRTRRCCSVFSYHERVYFNWRVYVRL